MSSLAFATISLCVRSRSGDRPLATVSRGEWSVSTIHSCPTSRPATAISPIELPPSDQSECVWQSPRSAERSGSPSGSFASTSFERYAGSRPARASSMTPAVAFPIPGNAVSVPASARCASWSGVSLSTVAAAFRNARTR
jgi:hypothetical protein